MLPVQQITNDRLVTVSSHWQPVGIFPLPIIPVIPNPVRLPTAIGNDWYFLNLIWQLVKIGKD